MNWSKVVKHFSHKLVNPLKVSSLTTKPDMRRAGFCRLSSFFNIQPAEIDRTGLNVVVGVVVVVIVVIVGIVFVVIVIVVIVVGVVVVVVIE